MKNIIPAHEGWNGNITWSRRHSSELFGMSISVHGEKSEERQEHYSAPRYWCSYLLGGDQGRWYREGKSEKWIQRCPVTDLVWEQGEDLFSDLPWNCGVTLFDKKAEDGGTHPTARRWKVGDDYSHLYDSEFGRWDQYDFRYIEQNLKIVADRFAEQLEARGIKRIAE